MVITRPNNYPKFPMYDVNHWTNHPVNYFSNFQPNFLSVIINLIVLYLIFFFVELALLPLSPPTKKSILHNSRSIFGVYMYLPFGQARFNLTNGEFLAQ